MEQDHEPPYEISVQEEITARLHFIKFENTYMEACLDFIRDHLVNTETKVIQATGGGAYKFKDLIEEKLRLKCVGTLPVVWWEALDFRAVCGAVCGCCLGGIASCKPAKIEIKA